VIMTVTNLNEPTLLNQLAYALAGPEQLNLVTIVSNATSSTPNSITYIADIPPGTQGVMGFGTFTGPGTFTLRIDGTYGLSNFGVGLRSSVIPPN
jgi:hypothetical protein